MTKSAQTEAVRQGLRPEPGRPRAAAGVAYLVGRHIGFGVRGRLPHAAPAPYDEPPASAPVTHCEDSVDVRRPPVLRSRRDAKFFTWFDETLRPLLILVPTKFARSGASRRCKLPMLPLARRFTITALVACVGMASPAAAQPRNPREVIILTTTTTQDSGILQILTDTFARKYGLRVKTIVAGSGDALKQGARGEGDVLLTHSPDAEKAWMADGNGSSRRLVMYNDFVIIGPRGDPARVKGLKPVEALRRIATSKAAFVSRGDQSGTHVRELAIWKRAGINPKGQSWYRETGQGQGLTTDVASQFQAYAFTDRGTYLVHAKRLGLPILIENDPSLYNVYHVMPVNSARFARVNARGGQAFADWIVSPQAQAVIAQFGKAQYGRSLFVPAAGLREEKLLAN